MGSKAQTSERQEIVEAADFLVPLLPYQQGVDNKEHTLTAHDAAGLMQTVGTQPVYERFKTRPDAEYWTANADGLPTFCAKEWLDQMVIKSTFTGAKAKVLASFTSGIAKAKKREAAAAELAPGKYLNCGHTWPPQ